MKRSRGRILMFVENHFPGDVRVKNEADMLTSAGYAVTVIGLKGKKDTVTSRVVDGIQVYLIPRITLFKKVCKDNPMGVQRLWLKVAALMGYMWEYLYFTGACLVMSLYVAMKHGFDVIHAHNPPDTLFLVAALYKPLGKKFVFDHHDLCPELYQSRYRADKGFLTLMLGLLEKGSLGLADVTIATNESYRQIQIERGKVKPENVFVVRNGPNLKRVTYHTPSERLRNMNKCILCYVGALNPQDGVDYLLRSLRDLVFKLDRKDFYCVVMGTGDSLEDLRALAKDLDLESYVELTGYVSDEDLMGNLSAADICVDPDPSSPLNDVSTWIKIMEYMAMGKPIVTYDLKETHWSAQDAALYVKPNNELEFAEAIVTLMDRPDLRTKMGEFGRQRVEHELKWDIVGQNLVRAYNKVFEKASESYGTCVRNELYYLLKPLIPEAIRISARRLLASRIRQWMSGSWPIQESTAQAPAGWLGWPNGKQFAFVVTHDVEGARGLTQCRKLADLNKALGIRAAFNFVPEGEYRVPDLLRTDLEREGFEVGVHDLYHDGSLYRSARHFQAQALKINQHLKAWGATGFRSGFMFHNLDWIHDLDILYDASTFDVDPFEPQPDGVGTIFPFWVQGNGSKGYVELPYTLSQDSTLFILLRERTIDLWTKKLDWVASHGGMAMVIIHPDYLSFDGKPTTSEYSADLYEGLLKYVFTRYGDTCWFALPREVAAFVAQIKPRLVQDTHVSDRRSDGECPT